MDHALKWICISCKIRHTKNSILYEMIKQVDPKTTVPMKEFSLDYYYSVLWKVIKENNVSLVVILDEIDYLKKTIFSTILVEQENLNFLIAVTLSQL